MPYTLLPPHPLRCPVTRPACPPLQEKVGRLRSRVDLGSQVFCEAEVPDTSMIYVKVGLKTLNHKP